MTQPRTQSRDQTRRLAVIVLSAVIVFFPASMPISAQSNAHSGDPSSSAFVLFEPLSSTAPRGNAGLFVGVNEFTDDTGISDLQFAVHDAIESAYVFVVELNLIPASNCYLLLSGEPSAAIVRQHLAELQRKGCRIESAHRSQILNSFLRVKAIGQNPSDLLVCAFSSHGFNEGRQAYIMPSDGIRELLSATAIRLQDIEVPAADSRAGHRLLLVDACQERISARGDTPGTPMSTAYLDILKRPTGQAKLASCSPGELSYENKSLGGVGHGIFTYSLLEALRGGARPDDQNLVRLERVCEYVTDYVTRWAKEAGRRPQTPFFEGPEGPRKLPLAMKGDDIASLIVALRKRATSADFTPGLREQLVTILERLDATRDTDRKLAGRSREFVIGTLDEEVFIAYLKAEVAKRRQDNAAPLRTESAPRPDSTSDSDVPLRFENSIGMSLTWIPAGTSVLGSPKDELGRSDDEDQRTVETQGFYMGVYEVTQREYRTVMKENPSQFSPQGPRRAVVADLDTDRFPVDSVSAEMADEFCRQLSALPSELRAGRKYRLPTEAEWEYACRGGSRRRYAWGDEPRAPLGTRQLRPHPVGSFTPNPFGLHDMHGNVLEWCSDWYLEEGKALSVLSIKTGKERILRGGSWRSEAEDCRAASRFSAPPMNRTDTDGFRVICERSE